MEFLGIGPLEFFFIILLIILIFGPKDIAKTSKTIGKSLNKFVRSDTWKTINQTSRELKNLPTRLMREAGLDELEQSAREEMAQVDTALNQAIKPDPDAPPNILIPTPTQPLRPARQDPENETPDKNQPE